jgi:hypothetical protein
METIPKHCIEFFRTRYYDEYPCINEFTINKEILDKLIKKSIKLWYRDVDSVIVEEMVSFDNTGIYIYYKLNENDSYNVFMLSTINKKDVVDFTLHSIKKLKEK